MVFEKLCIIVCKDVDRGGGNRMLAEFKVRNYKNFKDELQFSLKSAKSYEFHQEVLCNGIIKDAVVIGYNASGKTNLGLAMMDITTHLTDKYERRDGASIFYSNLYNEEDSASFVYQFIFDSSVLEYAYEKENAYQVRRECIRIDGKEVLKNEKGHCFVDLRGAETLNLANWDDAISFVKYVYANTVLDREDKDCQVFLKFMRFVNQMLWFSSTEGLRAVGANSVRGNMLEEICHMENGVKHLEDFLREEKLPFQLVEKDTGEGKTIYCKIGDREVAFAPLMSSGTRALVFLCLWYMRRKEFSFIYIDEFDAFYHTDLSMSVIRKLMMEDNLQVVFTSHNTDIISNELLRPDCYFLLEDNTIQPFCNLTDKALREAHNLQKMYRAGAFYGQ